MSATVDHAHRDAAGPRVRRADPLVDLQVDTGDTPAQAPITDDNVTIRVKAADGTGRPSPAIANELETRRLGNRVHRLEAALAVLRRRAADLSDHDEPVPAPLLAAIAEFGRELASVNRDLRELTPRPRDSPRRLSGS